ncbi:acyl-CoA dehydrogenase family protein [Tropicimonas isoalkanivorans]|uniref:Acyl-CoA dehydrogenase n=1 Tax=Tropicimonas isoalkanivorans TaxID=441112 RepID=A0A1I1I2E6_9RHOB|nr:acyl-CoA dehydrogenase family protein [Tropicimonas isoalkanivorans]SFC27853.1 Acyl-CoA dehydrogenase [Tropicimonas isoalkanivorans]
MELSFSPDELAFRAEVRAFIRDNLPEDIRAFAHRSGYYKADQVRRWQKILDSRGWAAGHWPVEFGGPGWTAVQRYIFNEELLRAPAPEPLSFNINMVGPVIYTFGTEEQKSRFLPKIRSLDWWFCQGFSEPGAGSDLAALKTSAVTDGDSYVINGQKIWTSTAQHADWMFALVRTDPKAPKKQMGISFLLIDMNTPGIDVRPIVTIDGEHHTNEVFFDNVRVPAENLIGEENKGWDYAKFLLGSERTGIARVGLSKGRMDRALELARVAPVYGGARLIEDPGFRQRALKLQVELKALEISALRIIDRQRRNPSDKPDAASSILKLRGAETQQASAELLADAAGPSAAPFFDFREMFSDNEVPQGVARADGAMRVHFAARPATIYGGASEVQKNIIAKAILGFKDKP